MLTLGSGNKVEIGFPLAIMTMMDSHGMGKKGTVRYFAS
jgi:hypothetical protein